MTDLTGRLISNTYKQLILVSSAVSNEGVDTSLKPIQTGDGTNTALKVATNAVQVSGALGVTGSVSLDSNLHVDNRVCASAFYGDGSNITGVTAVIAGNISVSNAVVGGTLQVSSTATIVGATHLKSTVTVGGAANFGSTVTVEGKAVFKDDVSVSGAANFGSTVTVEGAAIFNNNVSVSGTFNVAGASTFTSKATFDNDVSVSGRLDVATSASVGGTFRATGNAGFSGDTSVSGDLNVGGTVTIAGTNIQATNARVCASAYFGDGSNLTGIAASIITDGRIGGSLAVSAALTVGSTFDVGGNTSIGGTFLAVGAATFDDDVSVSGNVNIGGTTTIAGAVSLASTLSVAGASNFASTVTIAGATSLGSTLDVTGNTSIGGTFLATGKAEFKDDVSVSGNVNIGGTTTIAGAVSLASTLSVGGATHLASTVTVAGAAIFEDSVSVSGNIDVAGNVSVGGTLFTTGNITFDGNVSVSGNVNIGGTTTIGGAVSLASTLNVNSNTSIGGTFLATGKAEFEDDVSVSGALIVGGATQLNSTVTVAGAATFEGAVSVSGAVNIAGVVGIGTTSATNDAILTMKDTGSANPVARISFDRADSAVTDGVKIGYTFAGSSADFEIANRDAGLIRLSTNDTEALRIDSSQRVNIGTTTGVSGYPLHVANSSGSVQLLLTAAANFDSIIAFADPDSNTAGLIQYKHNGNSLRFHTNGGERMTISSAGAVDITGALSKGSGSFKIDHPLTSKKDTHYLVHSFIEGPQADLIYRGKVVLSSGSATVNIDTASGMTSGTFEALCTDVQCFTSNETGWIAVKGSVSGATLTIQAQDNSCTDTISWIVVGERKDPHMLATEWTDDNGKVIVEPEKSE